MKTTLLEGWDDGEVFYLTARTTDWAGNSGEVIRFEKPFMFDSIPPEVTPDVTGQGNVFGRRIHQCRNK